MTSSRIQVLDVAHPPRSQESVEEALDAVLRRGSPRAVKVIHGYGSSGKGGSTRLVVRNWAYVHRKKIRSTIPGEEYSRFDPRVQELCGLEGFPDDPDLDASNPGITVLHLR